MASVKYASFEDALQKLRQLGEWALLAKADIKSAFRLLPSHPDCFSSLGFFFESKFILIDFTHGLLIVMFYFESFSTFLEWVVYMVTGSHFIIHYFFYF